MHEAIQQSPDMCIAREQILAIFPSLTSYHTMYLDSTNLYLNQSSSEQMVNTPNVLATAWSMSNGSGSAYAPGTSSKSPQSSFLIASEFACTSRTPKVVDATALIGRDCGMGAVRKNRKHARPTASAIAFPDWSTN